MNVNTHAKDAVAVALLGGEFVEVALAVAAPDDDAIHADEVTASPALSAAVRLGAQQREVSRVVNLKQSDYLY